ncbi:J domain-containing protein [Duganella sp. BJB488]|uniref:J domain-containing protein n=1 Tax=unclassified Duganella TaxID=2636909 RepID=UPI000E34C8D6|nr:MULTISPECIES: J domain-containing protein [unclassified Duganella]NVD72116.1 J domain-containing protein [Duganella sp. BJB1802]RFP24111.1 J domain-containing protein [Duganella sp. BJB489]RFP26473.1 J domain-containing protein [Duganella sp. BJB488]RFP34796.1 J domain-containing protein [Duganella sp. BJB480]
MAKIHTHYDNLKVSRMAPQEVIRAAYKALSQKYHPDKNPGDEKAARIMAILNSAYDTLSDTQRRKEHDEWIAAEEWEIEWLESTHHEDGHRGDKHRHDGAERAWSPEPVDDLPRAHRRGAWKWWGGLAASLVVGWVAGVTMVSETQVVSSALAAAWGGKANNGRAAEPRAVARDPKAEMREAWAGAQPYYPEANSSRPAAIKVQALSQVILPNATADCESETQTLVAPNGEPWPTQSGYMTGFPVANRGDDMQLTLDNAGNASAVFIKIYDTERRSNVRYAYVQAHDKLVVDKLANGKYEIRYQNLDVGANQSGCAPASRTAAASTAPAPVNN